MILLPLIAILQGKPLECQGNSVHKSVFPNDEYIISGGAFRLINRSSQTVVIKLKNLEVCKNNKVLHQPESYFIYREGGTDELEDPIELAGKEEIVLEVSFPFFVVNTLPLRGYHVRVTWADNHDNRYTASSELKFELKR